MGFEKSGLGVCVRMSICADSVTVASARQIPSFVFSGGENLVSGSLSN